MKKHIIIIISLFLIVQNFNATEIFNNQIKIPKHYKTENTFSGDLSDTNSFHLIFAKNKMHFSKKGLCWFSRRVSSR
jgi:hypothetical protein